MKLYCQYVLLYLAFLASQYTHAQIYFNDNATLLGISASGGSTTVLGGLSFFDYDNDGWDDITIGSKDTQGVRFFKNNAGTFVEEIFNITITGHSKQVLWVDYDNDGDNDLFVTRLDGANKLFQNNGSFVFSDVTVAAGFPNSDILFTYGAAFGDYNNDGYLDVFLCNKDNDNIIPNQLYKNNGNGTFTDVSIAAGISPVGHLSFCASFFDFDKDGFQDIYISNDRFNNKNILYHNNGDETFTDVSFASGTGVAANAMSTTIDDYNNDGWLDIYVTNTTEGNHLFENNWDGSFTDVAIPSGTNFNSIGWGANFFDADNDTDLDLYVSSMIDNPNIGLLTTAMYECQSDFSYQIPAMAGFDDDEYVSFSNAIGDINNDGYSDFIVANQAPDNHSLWENSGGTNNWLKVKLEGVQSNKNGIGSWIEISVGGQELFRYTLCGEAFLGQNSATEIFGLGTATTIDYLKVKWLSGIEDVFTNVSPNQTLNIVEGSTLSNPTFETENIRIYPNPTSGMITVFTQQYLEVKVYSALGKVILTKTINQNQNTIDLSNYSKGMYVLSLQSDTSTSIKKIVLH